MDRPRNGFTIIEIAVAIMLMTVLLVAVAQTMAVVAQQRRARQYRIVATHEASNLMELVMANSYDQLTQESVESMELSAPTDAALPAASLNAQLFPIDTVPRSKRVTIEVAWTSAGGEKTKPIRVVAWKYDLEGATP